MGIANDDSFSVAGQIGAKFGLDIFQEARANRRIYEVLPTYTEGREAYNRRFKDVTNGRLLSGRDE